MTSIFTEMVVLFWNTKTRSFSRMPPCLDVVGYVLLSSDGRRRVVRVGETGIIRFLRKDVRSVRITTSKPYCECM